MSSDDSHPVTESGIRQKPLRHRIFDAMLMVNLGVLIGSMGVELISSLADFGYPFLDNFMLPVSVLALAWLIAPLVRLDVRLLHP